MIYFFTTASHRPPLNGILKSPFRKAVVKVRSYNWLARQSSIRAAACIFTDLDRLRHFELAMAGNLFRQLGRGGIRVLNDPARSCQREELLFRLHKAGLNRFRAYPAALDPEPSRFPVFLKCVSHHKQDFQDLIPDQATLVRRLNELRDSGFPLQYMLVIEFINREHRKNIYRRSTLYRIGDRMIAANPVTEASPFVKYGDIKLATEEDLAASVQEMTENPYADYMRHVFDIANIEYGRVDFGFDGEKPAVYEINTNPSIGLRVEGTSGAYAEAIRHSMQSIAAAVNALDGDDRQVPLVYDKHYFSRLSFRWSPGLSQP
ncbi:MAG TPA: hypothetical protein ENK49_06950 [Gammaproteobacteria bacterium]|nr:hypothetical protein [Gammaproteobacteria bacterium]